MKIFVYTLGCRVNQCESESIAKSFADCGHEILRSWQGADFIIVNTCTVTTKAEQKARRVIRIFASHAPVAVTGCYAQVNAAEIEALSPDVFVIPLVRKADLLQFPSFLSLHPELGVCDALRLFLLEKNLKSTVFDYSASSFEYHCRSYLKIQDGCDNCCGYCRVHIARGKSVFLDADTVVNRALEIEKNGYHEIVLAGVNLTMYDHNGKGLGGLLEKLLSSCGSLMRFRLSSMEPDNIDDRLIDCISDVRMQPYFHIPIQSASDKVIKRVNRKYSASHLEYVISRLRQVREDPFLACDLIAGLPGEEEEDFEITKRFVEENGFAMLHVFPYSPRPDTMLYRAKDRAPESVRDRRALELRQLSDNLNRQYIQRQIGKNNEVILEEHKNGVWTGLSGNYMRLVVKDVPESAECGNLAKVIVKGPGEAVFIQA